MPDQHPHLQTKKPGLFVLASGIGTSLVSLLAVYLLDRHVPDFNIMGWYADYVIPVGAIIVGFCAGSGYGLAAWISGTRLLRQTMLIILAFQVAVYFTGRYLEYLDIAQQIPVEHRPGFFAYYDHLVRSMAWQQKNGDVGAPFGIWGYALNVLEIIGFSLTGLVVPGIMMRMPYCGECQVYMKTRELFLIPLGVVPRKIGKKDAAGLAKYQQEMTQALEQGNQVLKESSKEIEVGDYGRLGQRIADYQADKKRIGKVNAKVCMKLVHCRSCHHGHIQPVVIAGFGEQAQTENLPPLAISETCIRNLQG